MVSSSLFRRACAVAWLLAGAVGAQVSDTTYLGGAAVFNPYRNVPLLLGNGFIATGGDIKVSLVGKDAADTGTLYFLNPITGKQQKLFSNFDKNQPTVDLGVFPKGAPIVFMYITNNRQEDTYTGANTPGTYNFDADPALASMAINHKAMPVSDFPVTDNDKRWAAAGRKGVSDTVVFGFEDQPSTAGSPADYNDIGFLVIGVGLDNEVTLPAPSITGTTPFKDRATITVAVPTGSPSDVKIFYTTNGQAPTFDANGNPTGSTQAYAGPFDVTATTTVEAVLWKKDSTGVKYHASSPATATFTKLGQLDAPVASPPGGTAWSDGIKITLTQDQGAEIHYVLCDPKLACADPTQSSPTYSSPVPLTRPTILKAIAYKTGYSESPILTASYLLSLQVVSAVYLDENGDGRIDAARIVLSGKPSAVPDQLKLDDPFTAGASVTLDKSQMTLDASGVIVARFPDKPFAFGTSFQEKPYGHIPAGSDTYPAQDFTVRDSVGPVVVSAEATPPKDGKPASLKVTFSEDVKVDSASKEFPFTIKRDVGVDPNGQIKVDHVVKENGSTYEYVLVDGSTRYPVDGDSLKLKTTPAVVDLNGIPSRMGTYIGVKGAPSSLVVDIIPKLDTAIGGDPIEDPHPVQIPITVVYQDPSTGTDYSQTVCLDCRTNDWSGADPARPKNFPSAPILTVHTKGAFSFDLAYFDHYGNFVNRARGTVTEPMLAGLKADTEGNISIGLKWYPVSSKGAHVGTGAYIVKGTLTTLAGQSKGPQGEVVNLSGTRNIVEARFGYLRRD